LKLGPILAQYLYQYKRLDLPGLGTFMVDAAQVSDSGKTIIPGISFETNPSVKADPVLINYISEHSGKMKALASADFYSYLQNALQFLNIGKPFLFEGIGSLVKKTSGKFAYAPGETMQEAMKEYSAREISATTSAEESFNKYDEEKKKVNLKRPLGILLILVSLVIVIWGGYALYQKTRNKSSETVAQVPVVDTKRLKMDTVPPKPAHYKYVLEITNANRAFTRYNMLRSYYWDVKMETKDSIEYKLYLLLPVSMSDTTRILDSLTVLNGRRVYIEY